MFQEMQSDKTSRKANLKQASLGLELKAVIERHFSDISLKNHLMTKAANGTVTAQTLANYVENTLYLISHTPIFLHRAKKLALEQGRQDLAAFYDIKLAEEDGHDKWAEQDKDNLKAGFGVKPDLKVEKHMAQLVEYIFSLIDESPHLYLSYIIVAEHLTVLAGPPLIENLKNQCGLGPELVSVVGNHAELDKEHVLEMVEAIDRLADAKTDRERFVEIAHRAMGIHNDFCNAIAE